MPRIELASSEELPAEDHELLASLSARENLPEQYHHLIQSPERDIYRLLAAKPVILESFRNFGSDVWNECGLSPQQRELVILTVARELDSEYEWHQHVRVALKEGLEKDDIMAVAEQDKAHFNDEQLMLIRFTQAFVHNTVSEDVFEEAHEALDEPTLVGLTVLIGIYKLIQNLVYTFELEPEEHFAGWNLENL